jgi:hypothetical protein
LEKELSKEESPADPEHWIALQEFHFKLRHNSVEEQEPEPSIVLYFKNKIQ